MGTNLFVFILASPAMVISKHRPINVVSQIGVSRQPQRALQRCSFEFSILICTPMCLHYWCASPCICLSISLLFLLHISSNNEMLLSTFSSVFTMNSNISCNAFSRITPNCSLTPFSTTHSVTKCTTVSSIAPHNKESITLPTKPCLHLRGPYRR